MSKKIGLISWPIKEKYPLTYIILGEMYDENYKQREILQHFHTELEYLYPFRCKIKNRKIICYNIEDFIYFQKKYKLTVKLKIIGNFINEVVIFRSPILYDLNTMTPLFENRKEHIKFAPTKKNKYLCLIFPYANPVLRGLLLNECLDLDSDTIFILCGNLQGANKESTTTLLTRRLLTCQIPQDRIIKIIDGKFPDCIDDTIEIAKITGIEDYILTIVCSSEDINKVTKWHRKNKKNCSINYLTTSYERKDEQE